MTTNNQLRQRTPRVECPEFLAFVRRQPCCVCGAQAEAAHIRMASLDRGKEYTGKAQKPDDRWCVPLCPDDHRNGPGSQHSMREEKFWARVGVDPFEVAEALFERFAAETPLHATLEDRMTGRQSRPMTKTEKHDTETYARAIAGIHRAIPKRANPWPRGRKLRSRP